MKKQKLTSKLELKKITISKLNSDQVQRFVGGNLGGAQNDTMHTCGCTDRLCEPTHGTCPATFQHCPNTALCPLTDPC